MKKITVGMFMMLLFAVAPVTETEALKNPFTAIKNKVQSVKDNANAKKLSKDENTVAANMLGLNVNERKNVVNSVTELTKSLQNLQKGLEKAKSDIRTQSVNIKTFDSSRSSAVGALAIELIITDLIEKVKILIVLLGAMKSGIQTIEKARQKGDSNVVAGLQQFRLMRDVARLIPLILVTAKAYVALGGKFVDSIRLDMTNSGKIASILNSVVRLVEDNVTKGILKTSKKGLGSVIETFEENVKILRMRLGGENGRIGGDEEIRDIFYENEGTLEKISKFLELLRKIFNSSIDYANGNIKTLQELAEKCERALGDGNDGNSDSFSISNDKYLPELSSRDRNYGGYNSYGSSGRNRDANYGDGYSDSRNNGNSHYSSGGQQLRMANSSSLDNNYNYNGRRNNRNSDNDGWRN